MTPKYVWLVYYIDKRVSRNWDDGVIGIYEDAERAASITREANKYQDLVRYSRRLVQ